MISQAGIADCWRATDEGSDPQPYYDAMPLLPVPGVLGRIFIGSETSVRARYGPRRLRPRRWCSMFALLSVAS
jgi:hypothetical protein